MKNSKLFALLLTASFLSACDSGNSQSDKGALINHNVDSAAGEYTGGFVASPTKDDTGRIASNFDNADRQAYDQAWQQAMESSKKANWKNPDTGNYGTITPHHRYKNDNDQFCRDFSQTSYVNGNRQHGRGTACQRDDGAWVINQ